MSAASWWLLLGRHWRMLVITYYYEASVKAIWSVWNPRVKVILSKGKVISSLLPFQTLRWLSIALRVKQNLYFLNTLTWPAGSDRVWSPPSFAASSCITLPLSLFWPHSFLYPHALCCCGAFVHAVPSAQSTVLSPFCLVNSDSYLSFYISPHQGGLICTFLTKSDAPKHFLPSGSPL